MTEMGHGRWKNGRNCIVQSIQQHCIWLWVRFGCEYHYNLWGWKTLAALFQHWVEDVRTDSRAINKSIYSSLPRFEHQPSVHMYYTLSDYYASVGGAQRHTVVIMFVCVCMCVSTKSLSRARSPCPLKIKRWNVQCKLNAILSWNEIWGFWIDGFIVELWRDLCCSPWQLFFPVPSPSKSKLPTTDCFSTWQFHLYHKADNELS